MNTKTTSHGSPGLQQFLAAHGVDVTGVISGYGRLRLRGSLRHLYQPSFMFRYLCAAGVWLKDFAGFVSARTNRVCAAAAACGRPLRYLESCVQRKEDLARATASTRASSASSPTKKRRRYRALNPWSPTDAAVLETLARGEWAIQNLRNGDLRATLFNKTSDPAERHRQTRPRRPGCSRYCGPPQIIGKVTGNHRYIVTTKGRDIITALLAVRHASIQQLLKIAA